MQSDLGPNSTGLPHEGQRVEFVLEDRKVAMRGTYAERVFHSRWSGYGLDRVRSWRSDDAVPAMPMTCA